MGDPLGIGRKIKRALVHSGRDPEQLYRDTVREEIVELVAELHRSSDVYIDSLSPQPTHPKYDQLFSNWDRRFMHMMTAQLERNAGAKPLTGKQLVMLFALCDRLAKVTAKLLVNDNG